MRTLLVDKDNQLICDTAKDVETGQESPIHLLDYARDPSFATLIRGSIQKEGEVAHGSVKLDDQQYIAAALCIPQGQSKLVRMVIVLRPIPEMKKEAV